jgi:hypothetical protein
MHRSTPAASSVPTPAEVIERRQSGPAEPSVVSSAHVVDALLRGGFELFRVDRQGTILERDGRAVVIPHGARMAPDVVDELRKIAGLSARELADLLAHDRCGF